MAFVALTAMIYYNPQIALIFAVVIALAVAAVVLTRRSGGIAATEQPAE